MGLPPSHGLLRPAVLGDTAALGEGRGRPSPPPRRGGVLRVPVAAAARGVEAKHVLRIRGPGSAQAWPPPCLPPRFPPTGAAHPQRPAWATEAQWVPPFLQEPNQTRSLVTFRLCQPSGGWGMGDGVRTGQDRPRSSPRGTRERTSSRPDSPSGRPCGSAGLGRRRRARPLREEARKALTLGGGAGGREGREAGVQRKGAAHRGGRTAGRRGALSARTAAPPLGRAARG